MSNTITLPGGVTLTLPALGSIGAVPPALAGAPQGLDQLLSGIAPAVGAVNPQIGAILAAISAVVHIGEAIHSQLAAQPAGSNPSMQDVAKDFWSIVTKAFPLPTTTPAAG